MEFRLCSYSFLIIFSDVCGLRNSLQVELLQDQTHLMLQEYCNSKGQLSTGKLRFGKILLTMPIISQVCTFKNKFLFKVLFTDCYTWQNFRLRLWRLINRLYTVIHKMKKSKTKVLPCVTVSE